MIRSSQMMLAHALQRALAGDLWRDVSTAAVAQPAHELLVRWFTDHPVRWNCFSIHHIIDVGEERLGMSPGEWYGPHKMAVATRALLEAFSKQCGGFVYSAVAQDACVFADQVHALCADPRLVGASHLAGASLPGEESPDPSESLSIPSSDECESDGMVLVGTTRATSETTASAMIVPWGASLFLQIPMRLGPESTLDMELWPSLKALMKQVRQCVGFVGGTPRHSLYFVGVTPTDRLIALDPHTTQLTPPFATTAEADDIHRRVSAGSAATSVAAASSTGLGWLSSWMRDAAPPKEPPASDMPRWSSDGRLEVSDAAPPLDRSHSSKAWDSIRDEWNTPGHAKSFHRAGRLHTVNPSSIDPSVCLGFFCRDSQDFQELCETLAEVGKEHIPLVTVLPATPPWVTAPSYRAQFNLDPLPEAPMPDALVHGDKHRAKALATSQVPESPARADTSWEVVDDGEAEDEETGFVVVNG
jgi:hypothetical protein